MAPQFQHLSKNPSPPTNLDVWIKRRFDGRPWQKPWFYYDITFYYWRLLRTTSLLKFCCLTAFTFARKLVNTKSFKDWEFQLTNRLLPECAKFGNYTEQYVECHLRHLSTSGMAPVGTCRMGAPNDNTAVVDHNLRSVGHRSLDL